MLSTLLEVEQRREIYKVGHKDLRCSLYEKYKHDGNFILNKGLCKIKLCYIIQKSI